MGVHGKSDERTDGEKRGVMSISFCFLSSRVRRHYTHIHDHKRSGAIAGGEVLKSLVGSHRNFCSLLILYLK
jgi:hypothetical protein